MDFNDSGLTIYQRRLLDCAAIVRNGKGGFNMRAWLVDTDCGAVCCAIGDYITTAKPEGLWLKRDGCGFFPVSANASSWGAVNEYFGLSDSESDHLFDAFEYPKDKRTDRAYVADRIERFVMEKVKA